MRKILLLLVLTTISLPCLSQTVYVTDSLRVNVRETEDKSSPVVAVVSSGMPLTVIANMPSGYSKIKLENGREGYIMSRFTVRKPPSKTLLIEAQKELEQLKIENKQIQDHLEQLFGSDDISNQDPEQLSRKLVELQRTTAHAMEIKNQRDQLQERVVNAERELQQLKREKQALEDSTNQDWFIYGGIVAFTGILLGVLIPTLGGGGSARKGGWDSY